MSWIKEANKLGHYQRTYSGFRMYLVQEGTMETHYEQREGVDYKITNFTHPLFIAIDKTGLKFEGRQEDVWSKIEVEDLRRRLSKREGVELEWRDTTTKKPLQP